MLDKVFWVLLVGLLPFCSEFLADTDIEYPTLNPNSSYCFEYTWYGPEYDNNSRTNDTCDDFKDNTRAGDSIPCAPPLVISGKVASLVHLLMLSQLILVAYSRRWNAAECGMALEQPSGQCTVQEGGKSSLRDLHVLGKRTQ
ncbi:hypothetical protein YQE_09672, partial [Dendroctonus ponderosae]